MTPPPNTKHATHVSFDQRCYTLKHSAPFQCAGGGGVSVASTVSSFTQGSSSRSRYTIFNLFPAAFCPKPMTSCVYLLQRVCNLYIAHTCLNLELSPPWGAYLPQLGQVHGIMAKGWGRGSPKVTSVPPTRKTISLGKQTGSMGGGKETAGRGRRNDLLLRAVFVLWINISLVRV